MILENRSVIAPGRVTPQQTVNSLIQNTHSISARGKFLFAGDEKFFVKGISYGAFRPNEAKEEYFDKAQLDRDFELMAAAGFNTVRIPHTMPPVHLLDIAQKHGLRVMVGLSAEQYVGYLIDTDKKPDIPKIIREKTKICAGHPALLCYGLGNEIPSSLARWVGRQRIEDYLRELYFAVKEVDPDRLITYVNYPTTEYLHLPFLDMLSYNVYLEDPTKFASYLARLQNLAGDRPLLMSEVGLDAYRNGVQKQADTLKWQIETSFQEGCVGVVIFSWTDEWFRGGAEVDDWEFGLTDRQRNPKQSLVTVQDAFEQVPFQASRSCPRISVVLCSYNGSRTIGQTLEHLGRLRYPNYEVVVVNDGSTDGTEAIIKRFPVKLISTENHGLSSARNTGWQASDGEIVAYIDDDAYPDPDWLDYLAASFETGQFSAVGGPNLSPLEDGWMAQCVARAPGGPTHVLLTDRTAEHIPGCNMAFRRETLEQIGGFDHRFRVAGDDVDICWRILDRGEQIGFSPAALVWHHRRPSISAFWRQQRNYGRSETLLHRKWPQKFNQVNHTMWLGRVYRAGVNTVPGFRPVIYHGIWGEAPYQSLHGREVASWEYLPMMPEWYLVNAALAMLLVLGIFWTPLLWAAPLLIAAIVWPLWHVLRDVPNIRFDMNATKWERVKWLTVIVALNAMQPLARLWGRLKHGLAPWNQRTDSGITWPKRQESASFETEWIEPRIRLERAETSLQSTGGFVFRSGDFDNWDLELHTGIWGGARMLMGVEDQGSGTQYVRFAIWPQFSQTGFFVAALFLVLGALAAWAGSVAPAVILTGVAVALASKIVYDAGSAMAVSIGAVHGKPESRN